MRKIQVVAGVTGHYPRGFIKYYLRNSMVSLLSVENKGRKLKANLSEGDRWRSLPNLEIFVQIKPARTMASCRTVSSRTSKNSVTRKEMQRYR